MARKGFGDVVKEAKAGDTGTGGTNYPPDGTYTATVVSGNVQSTKAGDNFRLGLRFVVDSGPETGKSGWNSQMLRPEDEMNVRIFSRMCEALGINTEKELGSMPCDTAEDIKAILEAVLSRAQNKRVQIKVRTKNNRSEVGFVNPLPEDAPPSQLNSVAHDEKRAAGAARVAAAASGPKKPARAAF